MLSSTTNVFWVSKDRWEREGKAGRQSDRKTDGGLQNVWVQTKHGETYKHNEDLWLEMTYLHVPGQWEAVGEKMKR